MIETVVDSIRVQLHSHHRVVILKELHGDRHLPIWIGDFEAQAIAIELQGVESPTAATLRCHETLIDHELGGSVDRILVVDLSQDVYFARIVSPLVTELSKSIPGQATPSPWPSGPERRFSSMNQSWIGLESAWNLTTTAPMTHLLSAATGPNASVLAVDG